MTDYHPVADGRPDPGEVCWAWVPYEDDPSQGKDRPVLVIAVHPADGAGGERAVACLVMTSKDHDRDAAQEASAGRHWMDVGTGAWDREHRPSEVRLDRLVTLRESDVRREGAALDPEIYDRVLAARGQLLG
ncbi:type II toxin-antitoxin system PemK/MazF family toxin [Nocardioides humilatus]|uniref:Type II toxin-antitoxin system PemK/MazF family toxin n=1 Tax=Nocardioides humilatus TaxID=2607660 RepID=A0A5B1LNB1_9ACTN|nr:type II toxin-antitoxin system PemK/MazF family toxin [Nocardioides humilatus]KAA1421119.1 type II toxin-antitoxin system PemK/MazF family toxin [Nocardioides humilatus]